MATKNESQDILKGTESLAHSVEGAEHWIEQHPKAFFGILGVIILAVAGFFGYRYYMGNQEQVAQEQMFQAQRFFESDSLDLALNGNGNYLGFQQIIDDYPRTKAANLATYYAGYICLKQGKFQLALFYLEDFESDDQLVQARAYSLMGDANMDLKKFDEAIPYYKKAVDYKPNKFFTPNYMLKLALAYEKSNKNDEAIKVYQRIIDEYWESNEVQTAKRYKARLETNS